jgi:hypothetical protein
MVVEQRRVSTRVSWTNPRILTTLLLVFLAGSVCGAFTMRERLHKALHNEPAAKIPGTQLSYDRLKSDLNLSPQQSDSIRMILDDMLKYHEDLQHQIEDVRATGKNRIRAVLTDDQKKQFERLCEQVQPPR